MRGGFHRSRFVVEIRFRHQERGPNGQHPSQPYCLGLRRANACKQRDWTVRFGLLTLAVAAKRRGGSVARFVAATRIRVGRVSIASSASRAAAPACQHVRQAPASCTHTRTGVVIKRNLASFPSNGLIGRHSESCCLLANHHDFVAFSANYILLYFECSSCTFSQSQFVKC